MLGGQHGGRKALIEELEAFVGPEQNQFQSGGEDGELASVNRGSMPGPPQQCFLPRRNSILVYSWGLSQRGSVSSWTHSEVVKERGAWPWAQLCPSLSAFCVMLKTLL